MPVHGLDHLIFATPDLDQTMEDIAERTGVRPVPGGSHAGRGTRNALFSLGDGVYVEVLAPDPAQPPEAQARGGVRIPDSPRLTTWAARCTEIPDVVESAAANGLTMGVIIDMLREQPDGGGLRWQMTMGQLPGDGLVPFVLDWGNSDHPSRTAPAGCTLVSLRAEHPDPSTIRAYLQALGVEDVLPVTEGAAPRIIAVLDTPRGEVELS